MAGSHSQPLGSLRIEHPLGLGCSGHEYGGRGWGRARSRARGQAVRVAGSVQGQGASSPWTTFQGAGGLEGEVSGTLWREGSRYMATVKGRERGRKEN